MSLKILFLNKDLPLFPGRVGTEYFHTTGVAKIASRVGLVSMVHTLEQKEKKRCLEENGVSLYLWENTTPSDSIVQDLHQPSTLRRIGNDLNDFIRTWPLRPADTYVEDLQFRNISKSILSALDSEHWDVNIVVQSSCAHWLDYLPRFPVNVLFMPDVRALVYERRATTAASIGERLLMRYQGRMYRKFERKYCKKYDLVITVSPIDEKLVKGEYQPKLVLSIPIPIDTNYFSPMSAIPENANCIIFTGMMSHPPNVDAACFFATDVLPEVQKKIPSAEFWIVGTNPSRKVCSLVGQPGVVVTGKVSDIRPYVAQAAVVVVPLQFGSGVRNKILEAWGMERCVVSTTVGAEGLDYTDGENILIADGAQALSKKIVTALTDKDLRNHIRLRGRETVISQHDPVRIVRQYYRAIQSVYDEKRDNAERPFRAVIDLRWMKPGVAGGIENLSRSFIDYLRAVDSINRYTLFVPSEIRYDFDLRYRKNFGVYAFDGPQQQLRGLLLYCLRVLHGKSKMDFWRSPEVESLRMLQRLNADVVLSMSGYVYTDMYPLRNVLVVHDLQHEYYPEFFTPDVLDERKRVFGDSIRQADRLIAVSEHTRQTVIEKFGIEPSRITTAHEAADPIFLQKSDKHSAPSAVWEKYGLVKGEYLLFPGNTWPHKNHIGALEALALIRDTYKKTPRLVLTGAVKEGQPTLLKRMQDLRLENQVQFLGYCPLEEMPALYHGAAMLIYPSYFEGFGIPLVEAMWSDCPMVCSNASSLPEVAGEAALLVDPRSPEELARAINQVLEDEDLRQSLIEKGRIQGSKFSWQKFTFETVRALKAVALGIN